MEKMGGVKCVCIVFAASLLLLLPYIALRIFGIMGCIFGHFIAEFLDFLQMVMSVASDLFYVYVGLKAVLKLDDKRLERCSKIFAVSFTLSVLSVIITTCFDDDDMIAISYDCINVFVLSFSGVSLFLLNMKVRDEKEEANNNS